MGKKYKAVFATTQTDLNGDRFSANALQTMAKQALGKLVFINFNTNVIVGKVIQAALKGEKPEVVIELLGDEFDEVIRLARYVVPGGVIARGYNYNGVNVLDDVKLTSFSFTESPADTSLPSVEEVKEG